jgi:hypothetical protein
VNNIYSYLLVSWLIFSAGFSFSQEVKTISPVPKINKHKKVNEGEIITFSFSIANPSKEDTLFILPPEIDCTCTTIDYPDYLLPQKIAIISIKFDTDKKWGLQYRTVNLKAEQKNKSDIYIYPLIFKVKVKATPETKAIIRQQIKESKK